MKYKKTTLSNGLRAITIPVKDSPTVMVLVMVETGSNYETKSQNGLSHFLEHMCFKGTTNRPKSSQIAMELDSLGAQNNAFTGNEYTGYYAKASKKYFTKLFDIISDLYLNPTLPSEELEKERGVIIEEINMYEDLPQRKVWDVLYELVYGNTPAGRSILGPKKNIKKFKRSDFVNYRNTHYIADKTFMIVAGDVSEKDVLKELRIRFKGIPVGKRYTKSKVVDKQKSPALSIKRRPTDQAHIVMAFRSFKADDKKLPALMLLSEILGKGMSSRLFTRLREEMGVCYYVRSNVDQFTDHGLFTISAGINSSRTEEVIKALLEECNKLKEVPVSEDELKKSKEHNIGNMYMDIETSDDLAQFYAEQEILTRKLKNPQELEEEIRKVTSKDIMKVAKEVFQDKNLNLAMVGNISNQGKIKKALSLK